jgi:hypothetical protein
VLASHATHVAARIRFPARCSPATGDRRSCRSSPPPTPGAACAAWAVPAATAGRETAAPARVRLSTMRRLAAAVHRPPPMFFAREVDDRAGARRRRFLPASGGRAVPSARARTWPAGLWARSGARDSRTTS